MRDVLKIKEVYLFQNKNTEHGFHFWIFPRHGWMEKFGRKIESVRPIIDYTKENMTNDNVLSEVKSKVSIMREFMSSN